MKKLMIGIMVTVVILMAITIEVLYYQKQTHEQKQRDEQIENNIDDFYDIDDSVISFGKYLDVRFGSLTNYKDKLDSLVRGVKKEKVAVEKLKIFIPYLDNYLVIEAENKELARLGRDFFANKEEKYDYFQLFYFIDDEKELGKNIDQYIDNINLDKIKFVFTFENGYVEEHILDYNLDIALDKVRIVNFDSFLKENKTYEERYDLENYFDQLYYYNVSIYEKEVKKFRNALNENIVKDDDISPLKYVYAILRYDEYLSEEFYEMVAKDLKEAYYQKSNLNQGFRYELCVLLESINKKLNFYDQTKLSDERKKFWNGGHISVDKILKEIE